MDISFDFSTCEGERRARTYAGALTILPPTEASLALVSHARHLIEEAFGPNPIQAQLACPAEEAALRLSRLKPHFIHHPITRELLSKLLLAYGCDPKRTYQDVPRIRSAFPSKYLSTGIAYAHHPHRDTWYSAPMCQINWWMPIYDFDPTQGMAFHPRYWNHYIANGSADFSYYRWNADGRKNAAKHVGTDTRVQPHPEEPIELEPEVCCVVPAGAVIVFSAAHLHSTVNNISDRTRWSVDFRTVDIEDVEDHVGAPNVDSFPTGTSLRDFRRLDDAAPMPEASVAEYDSIEDVSAGVTIYAPA